MRHAPSQCRWMKHTCASCDSPWFSSRARRPGAVWICKSTDTCDRGNPLPRNRRIPLHTLWENSTNYQIMRFGDVMYVKETRTHPEPGRTRWERQSCRCTVRCHAQGSAWFAYRRGSGWTPLPAVPDLERKIWRRSVRAGLSGTIPAVGSSASPSPANIWLSPNSCIPGRSNRPPIGSPAGRLAQRAHYQELWPIE